MVAPGGVVVEGRLSAAPSPGTSSPLTISITKGNLEYFGRILISLPSDCQLSAKQLHGGGMTMDPERNLAVISWLKLPDSQQFDLLLDLEVSPLAQPGNRTLEWDFSFIRNNDRETVRPAPFHFEVVPANAAVSIASVSSSSTRLDEANPEKAGAKRSPRATRCATELPDGRYEIRVDLSDVPEGGFVKCVETLPSGCTPEITSSGGSVAQTADRELSFVWFDFQEAGSLSYIVGKPQLSTPTDIIGSLSYIDGDAPIEIPVIPCESEISAYSNRHPSPAIPDEIWYEVQIAATKNRVVTDYFEEKLNFRLPLTEERGVEWHRYTHGHFADYRAARDCREGISNRHAFRGPFVVAKREGQRISVQEALTRTGQSWMP